MSFYLHFLSSPLKSWSSTFLSFNIKDISNRNQIYPDLCQKPEPYVKGKALEICNKFYNCLLSAQEIRITRISDFWLYDFWRCWSVVHTYIIICTIFCTFQNNLRSKNVVINIWKTILIEMITFIFVYDRRLSGIL